MLEVIYMIERDKIINYFEFRGYKEFILGVITFTEETNSREKRKNTHSIFEESILSKYKATFLKKDKSIKNLFYVQASDSYKEVKIYSSFSYVANIAIYIYSDTHDVGIDIEDTSKVEPLDIEFFKISNNVYKKLDKKNYKIKTISWCMQEAIGKLEKTGLVEKYVISCIKECDKHFEVVYCIDKLGLKKKASMLIGKINEFYLIINYRRV